MRACSHVFNLSLSSSYSEISESFSDKRTGVAEAVNGIEEVRVDKNRMKAGVRIMQSKSCRYDDEDINCREPYERASSLLYKGAHEPR